jgi:HK97 family phage major capsid protein
VFEEEFREARALLDGALAEGRPLSEEEESRYAELLATIERRSEGFDPRALRGPTTEGALETRAGSWLAAELRALTGSAGMGEALTPAQISTSFFDLLGPESALLRSGVTVIQTDRDELQVPRLKEDPAVDWFAPGAEITADDPDADVVTAVPRKLAGRVEIDNEVIADSAPSVLNILSMQLVRAIAGAFDRGAFEGTGTPPEITGLKNVSGIQTVSMGATGSVPDDLDPFADAIGMLAEQGAEATAIYMAARDWRTLSKLKEAPSGSNKPLLQESAGSGSQGIERRLYGVPVYIAPLSITDTAGASTDTSSAYVAEAAQIVAVLRQQAKVELDSSRLFDHDQSEVRITYRADVIVPNPKAVVRIVGLRPPTP